MLYRNEMAPLEEIICSSENDDEIISRARSFDIEHGTDIFSHAVQLTIYCIVCHKFDCTC